MAHTHTKVHSKEKKKDDIGKGERARYKRLLLSYADFRHLSEDSAVLRHTEKILWKLAAAAPRVEKRRLVALAGLIAETHFHLRHFEGSRSIGEVREKFVLNPAKWLALGQARLQILKFLSKQKHDTLKGRFEQAGKKSLVRLFKKYGALGNDVSPH